METATYAGFDAPARQDLPQRGEGPVDFMQRLSEIGYPVTLVGYAPMKSWPCDPGLQPTRILCPRLVAGEFLPVAPQR